MANPEYIKKYRDLPQNIKDALKVLKLKFSDLKSVRKVYWGAFILDIKENVVWTFNIEDMVKVGVLHIGDSLTPCCVAIHPEKSREALKEVM